MKSSIGLYTVVVLLSVVWIQPSTLRSEIRREYLDALDLTKAQRHEIRSLMMKAKRGEVRDKRRVRRELYDIFTPKQRRDLRALKQEATSGNYGLGEDDSSIQINEFNAKRLGLSNRQVEGLKSAARYSQQHDGVSFLVSIKGLPVLKHYPNGGSPVRYNQLASGTKSFSGLMAIAAQQDGLLTLDEKVSETITEWKSQVVLRRITIRELLTLTSGIGGGGFGDIRSYAESLNPEITALPGQMFQYGSDPFQIFGEVMRRKLGTSPLQYLETRIFAPIGLRYGEWRETGPQEPMLAAGAKLTALDWLKLGQFVKEKGRVNGRSILDPRLFLDLESGTLANPAYGLTWWLNEKVSEDLRQDIPTLREGNYLGDARVPQDLIAALGAGGQGLYISRQLDIVIVRQSDFNPAVVAGVSGFRHDELLEKAFAGYALGR